jgi:hypothetical protein
MMNELPLMNINVDVREVDPSCIDVQKQGGSVAVIVDTDAREVDPSYTNEGEHGCDHRCQHEGSRPLLC